jgi:hypothetical protein
VAEAAQQELRPPFKVPQSIFGEPHCLTDDYVTMESGHGFCCSSHLLEMISCVFNSKYVSVQLKGIPTKPFGNSK